MYIDFYLDNFYLPDYVSISGWKRANNVQQLVNVDGLKFAELSGDVQSCHELQNVRVAFPESYEM